MSSITRNVRDIDVGDRQALEHVLGEPLADDQQVVISIQPSSTAALPPWLDLYAGLRDDQIADLEAATLQRNDRQLVSGVQPSAADRSAIPGWLDRQREDDFRRVLEITKDLFGDDVHVKEDYDPEAPADKHAVFTVSVPDAALAVRLECEWVKRVRAISSRWPNFSLSLNVDE